MYYLRFHLDMFGYKGINLISSKSLKEIDQFIINNFQNRQDVIERYRDDIEEFCLDYKDDIISENKRNHNNRLGSITLFYNSSGVYHKIGIIYGNDKKLLSDKDSFDNLKKSLEDDKVLKEIFLEKKFLLSENEISLLSLYFRTKYIENKNKAIEFFLFRIKKMSDDERYYYYRVLMNICSLREMVLKTRNGNIKVNDIPLDNIKLTEKPKSYSNDFYFSKVIDEEDYDELFNLYDLDVISRDSNILNKDK